MVGLGPDAALTSQLYDPASNTWTPRLAVPGPNRGAALTLLPDGTPLLAQCRFSKFGCSFEGASLFDLQTEGWSATPPVVGGLGRPGLAVLPDGRVLLATETSASLFRVDDTTPRLSIVHARLDFGRPGLNATAQQVVTARNTGGATLTGSAATAAPFGLVSGAPFALAPGESAALVVQFTPSGFGTFAGAIQFTSNGNWLTAPVMAGHGNFRGESPTPPVPASSSSPST